MFEECDLSLIKFKDTAVCNMQINGSKSIGIVWHTASNPVSVNFKNSRISYSSFYGKSLKKMQVVSCIADETDFTNCNLLQSNFAGINLRNAIFTNTDLTLANFVNATNYSINLQNNITKKAKLAFPKRFHFCMDLILF